MIFWLLFADDEFKTWWMVIFLLIIFFIPVHFSYPCTVHSRSLETEVPACLIFQAVVFWNKFVCFMENYLNYWTWVKFSIWFSTTSCWWESLSYNRNVHHPCLSHSTILFITAGTAVSLYIMYTSKSLHKATFFFLVWYIDSKTLKNLNRINCSKYKYRLQCIMVFERFFLLLLLNWVP